MSPDADDCSHLTVDQVCEIHFEVLKTFGGLDGIRDRALLESAVATPQAGLGGRSLYTDVVEVAAAYLFFICRNHPFLDGNKRTALGACIVVLRLNGIEPPTDGHMWEELTLAVASGELGRDETTARLRRILRNP